MKAARGLPPLLLGALSHRLPSQPEDIAGQGITNPAPPPSPTSAGRPRNTPPQARKELTQATQLMHCKNGRQTQGFLSRECCSQLSTTHSPAFRAPTPPQDCTPRQRLDLSSTFLAFHP